MFALIENLREARKDQLEGKDVADFVDEAVDAILDENPRRCADCGYEVFIEECNKCGDEFCPECTQEDCRHDEDGYGGHVA